MNAEEAAELLNLARLAVGFIICFGVIVAFVLGFQLVKVLR